MATKLNPGADATLVGVAYRAAMAGAPGDYSKQFEKAAESYGETMEASSEMWGKIGKLGVQIGGEMIANANEFSAKAAKGASLDSEGADFIIKELYANKDAQRELFGIGFLQSRETRQEKAKLKIDQQNLFAEIDSAAESINAGAEAVGSGLFDATLNKQEADMVNAIIKSNLKDKVTKNKNLAKLTRSEKTGELTYTMYKEGSSTPFMVDGEPLTMTIKEFNKSIATNVDDKGAKAAGFTKKNNQVADRGFKSRTGVYDEQMRALDSNWIDTQIEEPIDLKRAMHMNFGFSETSFFDDLTKNQNEYSADLYSTLLEITGGKGALSGVIVDGMKDTDGIEGISAQEAMDSKNYQVLTENLLGMKDPEVTKAYFKDYVLKEFEGANDYGHGNKAPKSGSGTGSGYDGGGPKNPYGIPKAGLKLGAPMANGYRVKVRKDVVEGYINDIKSGTEFEFKNNKYTYIDNNWVENSGGEFRPGEEAPEKIIGNTQLLTDQVFENGGKYFDGLTTEIPIDPATGKAFKQKKKKEGLTPVQQLQDMFRGTEEAAIPKLKKLFPEGYSFSEGGLFPFSDVIKIYDKDSKLIGTYDFDFNVKNSKIEAERFYKEFKDILNIPGENKDYYNLISKKDPK